MTKENSLQLMAPWAEVKERIKETNIELTDEDLDYSPGNENDLLEHLSEKLNRSRDEIKAWIESISSNKGQAS
ncbi:MAG TPA: general stress protein CsbD [Chitinophagaceae bacterium]|nr:general stress protein CsbD [Chitinophagaceae bacterium]